MPSLNRINSLFRTTTLSPGVDPNENNIFSVIQLPDTDEMSRYCRATTAFNDMMQWIADNKTTHNIKIVMSPGDVHGEVTGTTCNNTLNEGQFPYISDGYTILDNNSVPYLISPANHDQESDDCHPRTTTLWDSTYPVSRFTNQTGFSANYNSKTHTMTNVQTLGGKKFMFATVEQLPSDAVVSWLTGQINTVNPDYVVLGMQEVIKPDGSFASDADVTGDQNYSGQVGVNTIDDVMAVWHDVFPAKFILTFGQSYLNTGNPPGYEWAERRVETNQGAIQNFCASNFGTISGCDAKAYLVRYEINVAARTINVYTYNPNTDTSLTTNSPAQRYQHQLTF